MTVCLLAATPSHFAQMIAGKDPAEDIMRPDTPIADAGVLTMLAGIAATVALQFAPSAWLIINDERLVGLMSITALIDGGVIQIGYGVSPQDQGNGHASAAVAKLLDWARTDTRVSVVVAETSISNIASQRVLEHNGFRRVGERVDEDDGDLFCWRIAT